MLLIPYPTSKKEFKDYEKSIRLFLKIFPKLFLLVDISIVLLVNIFLSLFVQEFKTRTLLEFLGSLVGLQLYFIFPITLISLFIMIVYFITRKK
jgi:hypothetical protein